jgi:3-oxoacyl-[acyl-carrier protein] reductase
MAGPFDGRIALVTGSGGGMGRSHAVVLAERGADVVVHDIKRAGVEETAELVRRAGGRAHAITVDIRDVPAFTGAIAAAEESFGPVDILVNNAGISGKRRTIEEIDEAIFDEMFAVHVKGAFFATRAVVPGMKRRRAGRIVNISSIYAMGGSALASHYAAAKAALSGFTKSWARELAPWRINVNAVAPGFIETDMTRGGNSEEQIRARERTMPLGRFVAPIEISYAVAWLASPEADMVTGQVVSPNAGETIVGY